LSDAISPEGVAVPSTNHRSVRSALLGFTLGGLLTLCAAVAFCLAPAASAEPAPAADPPPEPAPVGVPHLPSPENPPPGTTTEPVGQTGSRGLTYLRELWHAMQTQEISMQDALLLFTQRPLDPDATPPPGMAPHPQPLPTAAPEAPTAVTSPVPASPPAAGSDAPPAAGTPGGLVPDDPRADRPQSTASTPGATESSSPGVTRPADDTGPGSERAPRETTTPDRAPDRTPDQTPDQTPAHASEPAAGVTGAAGE
jgi:hypothetical protein